MSKKVLEATPVLQSALTGLVSPQGYTANYQSAPQRRSSISDTDNSGGGGYKYNSDFTIKTENTGSAGSGNFIVKVVDGGSYDPQNNTCSAQFATVNGFLFTVPLWQSKIFQISNFSGMKYLQLKYTPRNSISSGSSDKVEIEMVDYPNNDTLNNAFYLLGYVEVYGFSRIITKQLHVTGVARFYHTQQTKYIIK